MTVSESTVIGSLPQYLAWMHLTLPACKIKRLENWKNDNESRSNKSSCQVSLVVARSIVKCRVNTHCLSAWWADIACSISVASETYMLSDGSLVLSHTTKGTSKPKCSRARRISWQSCLCLARIYAARSMSWCSLVQYLVPHTHLLVVLVLHMSWGSDLRKTQPPRPVSSTDMTALICVVRRLCWT